MDIEVARGELERWRVVDREAAPLAGGEARLRIDRFGFSSNNVTYAVIGDLLRYWDFFPAAPADPGDGTHWGRVPVWGFAEVAESRSPDVAPGERLFGFLPMSTELVIVPGRADDATVTDVSPHRAALAGPYNSLRRCTADPVWRPDGEDLQMLLFPLFFTSFVIDDFLADQGDFGAAQVVVTSASAKTSLGLAHLLHARGRRVVGLTSGGNAGFCRSLGVYDDVRTYDDVDGIAGGAVRPGRRGRRPGRGPPPAPPPGRRVGVLDDRRGHPLGPRGVRARAGVTGPRPEFFFAPSQVSKRSAEWGADELGRRMAAAWTEFAGWVATWLTLDRAVGPDAVIDVFRTYLSGRIDPRSGTICTLSPGEVPA